MTRKPRVFIGSSVESLPIADAINGNLDHTCEVTIWRNGTFKLSNNTIDDLVQKAASVDFSIFIFSPDDLATIRENEEKIVRDNVIFELGLFIGTIGKHRCYIVKPRGMDLHFPTDLLGITTTDYDSNRSDGDLISALNFACIKIKESINKQGLKSVQKVKSSQSALFQVNEKLNDLDFHLLTELIPSFTENPGGLGLWEVKRGMGVENSRIDLSSIKLERLGYIQKENAVNNQGDDYYAYTITQNGIDILLDREDQNSISIEEDNDLPF